MRPSLLYVVLGLLFLAGGVPLLLGKVPPNALYGLRTRKTLENREVWYIANRFAGGAIMAAGGLILLSGLVLSDEVLHGSPPVAVFVVLGSVLAMWLACMIRQRSL